MSASQPIFIIYGTALAMHVWLTGSFVQQIFDLVHVKIVNKTVGE